MEFFRFTQDNGKRVNHFHSDFVISRIAEIQNKAQISCMYLQQNGVIGYHEAVVNQLLFVVSGEGFVCDEQRKYISNMDSGSILYGMMCYEDGGVVDDLLVWCGLLADSLRG